MDASGLRVEGVTVTFASGESRRSGAVDAVSDVSFGLAEGGVLSMLGPSGSGKSTLLRAIAGLEGLSAGRVLWDGEDITRMPVHRRGFALVFQDGQLFAHRNVAENVGYALRIAGVSHEQRERRIAELLELVGMPGFGSRSVVDLSGGEQQRVALARALAAAPRLLLMDEPFSSLDRELRGRLSADVRRILTETGTTAILVTHDQEEAFTVGDRVGVMMGGELVQLAEADALRTNPVNAAVARFLGVPLDGGS